MFFSYLLHPTSGFAIRPRFALSRAHPAGITRGPAPFLPRLGGDLRRGPPPGSHPPGLAVGGAPRLLLPVVAFTIFAYRRYNEPPEDRRFEKHPSKAPF